MSPHLLESSLLLGCPVISFTTLFALSSHHQHPTIFVAVVIETVYDYLSGSDNISSCICVRAGWPIVC